MSAKPLGKLILIVFVLWASLTAIGLYSMKPGEPMGILPQLFLYYVIPYSVWFVLMYWFMKRIAADEIKKHIDDAAEHRKCVENLLTEISAKLGDK